MTTQTKTIYAEILPGHWPSWASAPYEFTVGRLRRRAPKGPDRATFIAIEIEVDLSERFATRGIEVFV